MLSHKWFELKRGKTKQNTQKKTLKAKKTVKRWFE